ncbi:hypothetical protein GC173_11895 [bacterium]|nr:hypothetical protein [bacterium]
MARLPNERDSYLHVTRPRNACLLCSAPLNVDGRHPSVIVLSDKEEAIRQDFCPTCWGRMTEKGYFSFWVTKRVNAPSAEQRRLARGERNEALWRLFSALHSSGNSDLAPQLFFLAHLLMRYKVLTFSGLRDGKLAFLHPKLEETYLIDDLPIESIDFLSVKNEVEAAALAYVPDADEDPEPPEGNQG